MKFCTVCESILVVVITTIDLYHQCARCKKIYESDAKDTLRFSQSFDDTNDTIKYNIIMKNALLDDMNPRIYKECAACNREIVKYIIIGSAMRFVYLCDCGNVF